MSSRSRSRATSCTDSGCVRQKVCQSRCEAQRLQQDEMLLKKLKKSGKICGESHIPLMSIAKLTQNLRPGFWLFRVHQALSLRPGSVITSSISEVAPSPQLTLLGYLLGEQCFQTVLLPPPDLSNYSLETLVLSGKCPGAVWDMNEMLA